MKLNPIERLARDICWAGFTSPAAVIGKTRASYWRDISPDAREEYRQEARRFAWLLNRVPVRTLDGVKLPKGE